MNINNNNGFLYAEALIIAAIILIIFTGSAIVGKNFLLNITAEYEAAKLISAIRFVQEQNRNSYVVREEEFKKIMPKNSTLFKIEIHDNSYNIKSMTTGKSFYRYYLPSNVNYSKTSSFKNGVVFFSSGDINAFGTATVSAKIGSDSVERFVIIDRAGRIRMDRKTP